MKSTAQKNWETPKCYQLANRRQYNAETYVDKLNGEVHE